jgi:hypothetical protein
MAGFFHFLLKSWMVGRFITTLLRSRWSACQIRDPEGSKTIIPCQRRWYQERALRSQVNDIFKAQRLLNWRSSNAHIVWPEGNSERRNKGASHSSAGFSHGETDLMLATAPKYAEPRVSVRNPRPRELADGGCGSQAGIGERKFGPSRPSKSLLRPQFSWSRSAHLDQLNKSD